MIDRLIDYVNANVHNDDYDSMIMIIVTIIMKARFYNNSNKRMLSAEEMKKWTSRSGAGIDRTLIARLMVTK